MTAPKIVVTSRVHAETLADLEGRGRIVVNRDGAPWPAARLADEIRDAAAVMAFMTDRVDAAAVAAAPALRIVSCALKGHDNFDAEACAQAGVWVSIVPDLLTVPTAELTVGLIIGLARHVPAGDRHVRGGAFAGWRPELYGTGLQGSRIGIIGMGAIGRAIAKRLAGFGADLVYWDRRSADAAAGIAPGLRRLDRADLFATSDILVVALPLTDGTLHLIDRDALATVKPGALLVNPARGSVVDEAAVADALAAGHLGGYAADVFEMEDWARPDRPRGIDPRLLADRDRTLFTPHLGSAVGRVRLAIEREAAANIIDVLEGRAPRGAVNRPDAAALGLRAGTAGC